jgi:endo-1,4-beta-mannosidase
MSELKERIRQIIHFEMVSGSNKNAQQASESSADQIMDLLFEKDHPAYNSDAINELDGAIEAAFSETEKLRQLFAFRFGVKA